MRVSTTVRARGRPRGDAAARSPALRRRKPAAAPGATRAPATSESALADSPSRVLFDSPLVRVGSFRCPIGHPRFADSGPTQSFCFVFPRTAVWIQHEGAQPFVADPTVIPLYNRAHPYRRRAISPHGDRTDWFGVAPELLRDALACHDPAAADAPERLFRSGACPGASRIYMRQRAVFDAVAHGRPDEWLVEESVVNILEQVLGCLYRAPPGVPRRDRHREVVEDARAHLALTFSRNESLSRVAAAVGVSVFHLCRLFRRLTGRTLHRHRGELRMQNALERLREPGSDILAVATELGYSGHSHFTAAFRSAFGCTPSEWRSAGAHSAVRFSAAGAPALRR
jgi:AraC family transcriptional regulator